jgi:hypothetical protein
MGYRGRMKFGNKTRNQRYRLLLNAESAAVEFPAPDAWNFGTDGDGATWALTATSGGDGGTGLTPILDVISNTNRRFTGIDFNDDGTACVAVSYDGNIASFALSTAYDLSTATQTGSTSTVGGILASNVRFSETGEYITWNNYADQLHIMPLATAWVVASTDTKGSEILTKTELQGYTSSFDPNPIMVPDGTGVWTAGLGAVAKETIIYVPLSTPYDFSTNGTPVVDTLTDYGPFGSPTTSSLWCQPDGLKLIYFQALSNPDQYQEWSLTTANDASSGVTRTTDTTLGSQTQTWGHIAFSRDLQIMFSYNPVTPTSYKRWDLV